ncbi:MAG TPA: HNH endonuclease [Burkholderiales bacterium]|mgnify:CR=1 FL=1|nr:HNH endonuclease [Burkholderiales bacterium]
MKKVIIAQYFHYAIEEILPISELEKYKEHRRLRVFYHKGCKCANPNCNVEGTQLAWGKDYQGNLHLDLYDDNFYPMTVDHIKPKSLNGSDDLSNLRPTCYLCNHNKGNGFFNYKLNRGKYPNPTFVIREKEKYTQENIKPGDIVYKGFDGKYEELGILSHYCINPHTNRKSIMVENNDKSMWHVNRIYKKIDDSDSNMYKNISYTKLSKQKTPWRGGIVKDKILLIFIYILSIYFLALFNYKYIMNTFSDNPSLISVILFNMYIIGLVAYCTILEINSKKLK